MQKEGESFIIDTSAFTGHTETCAECTDKKETMFLMQV
jgi:hypothetical protein